MQLSPLLSFPGAAYVHEFEKCAAVAVHFPALRRRNVPRRFCCCRAGRDSPRRAWLCAATAPPPHSGSTSWVSWLLRYFLGPQLLRDAKPAYLYSGFSVGVLCMFP